MNFWTRIKSWLRGWRLAGLIVLVLIIALIGYRIYQSKHDTSNILTEVVQKQDLKQTVLATGVVTSSTDLNLSFKASGTVTQVNTAVGNHAQTGQILATLDQKDQLASLTSARGALASAQANYDKIVSGASNEDIAVAQATLSAAQNALDITRAQQTVLVSNAFSAMLNSGLAAISSSNNNSTGTVTVSGTYTGTIQGQYLISLNLGGSGFNYKVSGLEAGGDLINRGVPLPLGTKGLFVTFGISGTYSTNDTWVVSIPNTQASTYLANSNAYQAALQTQASAISSAQSTVDSAQAALNLKKAQARPADVEAANAQLLSAQGQVQAANAALENTIIRAPASGTITKVDIKVGQTISSFAEAIVLQNIDQLHLEANISEANVAQVKNGQTIDVTFDAFGPDQHYSALVSNIDLASTVVSGVVNYKITASLAKTDSIRPGMTANMTVLTDQKSGVLAVPERAIIEHGSKQFVRVITDSKNKTYKEQEVTLGITGDGGLVEITSGLSDGVVIVTFINPK